MRSWIFFVLILFFFTNSHANGMQATRIGIYLGKSIFEIAALVTTAMAGDRVRRAIISEKTKARTPETAEDQVQNSLINQVEDTLIAIIVLGTIGTVLDLHIAFPSEETLCLSNSKTLFLESLLKENCVGTFTCALNLILTTASVSYPISQIKTQLEFFNPALHLSYASAALFATPVFAALITTIAYLLNVWINPSVVMGIALPPDGRRQAWPEQA